MTKQFDIFDNPDPATREDVPYLVVLQSHLLYGFDTVIVAPLMRAHVVKADGYVTVRVEFEGQPYTADVALLTHIQTRRLGRPRGSLTSFDYNLTRATDRLFSGF